MISLLALAACFTASPGPVPPPLPEGAATVTLDGESFAVDGSIKVPFQQLEVDPVDAVDPDLLAALQGKPAVWVALPEDVAWYRVRKILGSARAAGVTEVWLSAGNRPALRAGEARGVGLRMSCREGPLAWSGVTPRVTIALQRSMDGMWALATARFLPVVAGQPTDGLPPQCLRPATCAELYSDAEAVTVCEAARGEPVSARVTLGAEVGCLLPLVRKEGDLALWDAELPRVLGVLALGSTVPVVIAPEARIRFDAIVTTLAAFEQAGLPAPALGQPLIEGNDGAPLCVAEVRSGAELKQAAARYTGSILSPPAEEEASP